jgi:hypothetical protein
MKIKTSELTGAALDWAVAKCEDKGHLFAGHEVGRLHYTSNWAEGGPIIERLGISVIQLERESIPDAEGFWQGEYRDQWGAVIGDRHSPEEQHGPQGDYWGRSYHVDENAVSGPTPLIAAMRCYVASKLGDEVDVPDGLALDAL